MEGRIEVRGAELEWDGTEFDCITIVARAGYDAAAGQGWCVVESVGYSHAGKQDDLTLSDASPDLRQAFEDMAYEAWLAEHICRTPGCDRPQAGEGRCHVCNSARADLLRQMGRAA